jgi:hypothetical protein
MTNDPRDPLGGQQSDMPEQNFGRDSGQSAGSGQGTGPGQGAGSGQGAGPGAGSGQGAGPGAGSGQGAGPGAGSRPGAGAGQQPGRGSTPATGASSRASSGSSVPPSEERTYEPQEQTTRPAATTTRAYETPQASRQAAPARTYDAPPKSRNNRLIALLGIVGLLALGGLIAGLTASYNHSPTVPAAATSRGHLVASVSGTGVKVSAPFKVTRSPVTARYSYRCTTGTHPFVAALAVSRANVTPITSTRGTGGSRVATVFPRSVGSFYRVAASSPCPYHVSVFER